MRSANGFKLAKMSLGRPCVLRTAACDVKLLLIWL